MKHGNNVVEIYSASRKNLSSAKERVYKEDFSDKNKELIVQFVNHHFSSGISAQRCVKILGRLRYVCRHLKNDLCNLDKNDLVDLFTTIKSDTKYAEASQQDFIIITKQFFRWFEEDDDRPFSDNMEVRKKAVQLYKYLRNTKVKSCSKKISPSDILTDDDIQIVLRFCRSIREKAFIRMLHESGARIGEMLNTRIGDISFSDDGRAHFYITDGKTGPRRVPVVYCVPMLRMYIECHPHGNDKNSFLWWTEKQSNRDAPIKYRGACDMVNSVWKRISSSEVVRKKMHNPHFFRHSRATLLAPSLTGEMLSKYMGWTAGSKEAKTYVHLCPDDLDRAYYRNLGFSSQEEQKAEEPKVCIVCDTLNDSIASYCLKCGKPLSSEQTFIEDARANQQNRKLEKVLRLLEKNNNVINELSF